VVVAEHSGAHGIMGVIDGSAPKGVETEKDQAARHSALRRFGYKQ
jgi:adenosine/AMP kinase